ncbi:universal stress protein [Natronococcus wangiae]|uniref:universal stress protein n=1 Tax=Natronococcus wangiae TaxID=3068275 RepID=UPI00273D2C0E|nr:universal stress protein [Natronococcus sp. AD5]
MPANVLVPLDRSSQSIAGLVYTLVSFPDATVTALHVIDVEHDAYGEVESSEPSDEQRQRAGERLLERATEVASEYDRTVEKVLETGIPHRTIVEYTVEHDIDHVVMGSHGESPVVGPFLGHVSEAVVQRVPVSTTIVPESQSELLQRDFPGRILVPVDGSEQSIAALKFAISQFSEGQITILHTVRLPFEYKSEAFEGTGLDNIVEVMTDQGEAILDSVGKVVEDNNLVVEMELTYGDPSRSILEYAVESEFDQIVMGSHGRSLPARIIVGSVAETVSRRSTISVTLVRGRPNEL